MDMCTHRGIICSQKMQIFYWSGHRVHEPGQVQVAPEEQLMVRYRIIHVALLLRQYLEQY